MADNPDDERDHDALRARLDRLSSSLDAQNKERAGDREPSQIGDKSLGGAMSLGLRVMSEFVAGIVVGAIIGWQLDVWLKTSPILLIVFLTLGTAAGFWNVYRIATKPTGRGPF